MRIRLHEVEVFAKDVAASRDFYKTLGLRLNHDEPGLNVFDAGWPGIDFDTSRHLPGKTRITFVVDSLEAYIAAAAKEGRTLPAPKPSHLGMQVIELQDPDGNIVEIQELSAGTPAPVRQAYQ